MGKRRGAGPVSSNHYKEVEEKKEANQSREQQEYLNRKRAQALRQRKKLLFLLKSQSFVLGIMAMVWMMLPEKKAGKIKDKEPEGSDNIQFSSKEIKRLMKQGQDVRDHLVTAIRQKDAKIVNTILRRDQSYATKSLSGEAPPIFFAIGSGTKITKYFIEAGADVNVLFPGQDFTPLNYAIRNEKFDVAALLFKNGAKLNEKDIDMIMADKENFESLLEAADKLDLKADLISELQQVSASCPAAPAEANLALVQLLLGIKAPQMPREEVCHDTDISQYVGEEETASEEIRNGSNERAEERAKKRNFRQDMKSWER